MLGRFVLPGVQGACPHHQLLRSCSSVLGVDCALKFPVFMHLVSFFFIIDLFMYLFFISKRMLFYFFEIMSHVDMRQASILLCSLDMNF